MRKAWPGTGTGPKDPGRRRAEPDQHRGGPARAGAIEAYELARAAALGQRGDGFRHGLAVIGGRGMAAWLALQTAAPLAASCPAAADSAVTPVPGGVAAGQIVSVLAAMTLAAARFP